MRITVMKSYWGMMTRLVMLGGCPVMTKTVIEQYLFASALYYGQIQSCRYLFGKTDIFASFSKASGFIVYFLMIWQIFILFIYLFFFSNLEIGKGIMVSIQYMPLWVIAIFRVYRKFNCFNNLDGHFLG